MTNRISAEFQKIFRQETFAERWQRILPGAIYSAAAGLLYILVPQVFNVLLYRGLHLSLDWVSLLSRALEFGLGLALAGAIVGWFTETYEGIVYGGVLIAILLLAVTFLSGSSSTLLGQSIIVILPLLAACMLVAGLIRVGINRHVSISKQSDPGLRRKQYLQLAGIVFLVGFIPGIFTLPGSSSLNTIKAVDKNLQNYASDPLIDKRYNYAQLPGLKSHLGMDYTLYVRSSMLATDSMEITVRFQDGYAITCLVPKLDSPNNQLMLDTCVEGRNIK